MHLHLLADCSVAGVSVRCCCDLTVVAVQWRRFFPVYNQPQEMVSEENRHSSKSAGLFTTETLNYLVTNPVCMYVMYAVISPTKVVVKSDHPKACVFV